LNRKQKKVLRNLFEVIYYFIKYLALIVLLRMVFLGLMLAYIYGMLYFTENGEPETALALAKMLRAGVLGAIIYGFLSWTEFIKKNGICKRQKDI